VDISYQRHLFPNLSNQDETDDGEDNEDNSFFIDNGDVETVSVVAGLEREQQDITAQFDLVNNLLINKAAGLDKSTNADLSTTE
jgi:hypothetical protein